MWQVLTLAVLLALMIGAEDFAREASRIDTTLDPKSLAATGFIILGAFTCGEISRKLRLPALIGYLVAGILFGPSVAALLGAPEAAAIFSHEVIGDLKLVNVLAVGVVGTMGGCEIQAGELRRSLRVIATIFGLIALLVLPSAAGVVLGLAEFAPALVPFFVDVPLPQVIGGAALIGVMAMGMSPAATIALLQETGGKGPFSSLALGVVVVADLMLVAMFLVVLALTKLTLSPEGISSAGVAHALPEIGAEFGWAILLGIATGLLFILYLRFVKREVLLFSLGLIFAATYAAEVMHAETLLIFLTAGFVVQNLSRHGHALLHAFEQIALPVFVVYFTTQAANLNLHAVSAYLPLALILVVTRVLTLTASVRLGARLAGVGDKTRRYLWLCFFSQGGVDLVLAAMVAAAIPGWGAEVQALITSTVIIYLFLGPPLFKLAIERVGESTSARARGLENLSSETETSGGGEGPATMPEPSVEDQALGARLTELREAALALDQRIGRGRVGERLQSLEESLQAALQASDALLVELRAAAEDAVEAPARRRAARARFVAAIAGLTPSFAAIEPDLWTAADLQELFAALEGMERFSATFEVRREEHLFRVDGSERALVAVTRRLRRLRRRLVGPGTRTVPLGRLWRYHIGMGVPIELWRRESSAASELWAELGAHVRALAELEPEPVAGAGAAAASADDDPIAAAEARAQALRRRFQALAADRREALTHALACGFQALLRAVQVAGTIELPAYRYRLSRRFDEALAARADLIARCEQGTIQARGARDALIAWASARGFEAAALAEIDTLSEALEGRLLQPAAAGLAELRGACEAELAPDLGEMLVSRIGPALADARWGLARSEALLGDGQRARATASRLRGHLQAVPEELWPLAAGPRPRPIRLALRRWLHLEVEVEAALLLSEASDRIGAALRQGLGELDRLEAVVDYYRRALAQAGGDPEALAGELRRGLARLQRQGVDLDAAFARQIAEIEGSLRNGLQSRLGAALGPVLAGRHAALQRRLGERDAAALARPRLGGLRRLGSRAVARIRALRPLGAEAWAEVHALFAEDPPAEREHFERLLAAANTVDARIPLLYRRLFGPAPDAVDLLVERPGEIAPLRAALSRWRAGASICALVHGDRGAGKRTLVRQALADLEGAATPVVWLRLTSAIDGEAGAAAALADLAGLRGPFTAFTFEAVARALAAGEVRRVIVVENGERLFRRTPRGEQEMRRFLAALRLAGRQTMWIVLAAEAGAALVESVLSLRSRFDVVAPVGPMAAGELSAMLLARHRLSGYGLTFAGVRPGPLERALPLWSRGRRDQAALAQLHALAGGNARQALILWLAAAVPAQSDNHIVVGALPRRRGGLLGDLGLDDALILAALVQHGPLRPADLAEVSGRPPAALEVELGRLRARGLLAQSASDPQAVLIAGHVLHLLTLELRQRNMV